LLKRRQVLRIGAAAAGALIGIDAFAIEPRWLDVTSWRVSIPDLPSELEGLLVAHVTDIHLSSIGAVHRAVAETLAKVRPDLVVVTGDVVDDDARVPLVADFVALLRSGDPKTPVLATLGNWEHWGNVNRTTLADTYARAGAKLLGDENVEGPRGLVIVSTDDGASGFADVHRAFREVPNDPHRPRILLTHAPGLVAGALPPSVKASLTLAGHTHGGQVRVATKAIALPPGSGPYEYGPYATPVGPMFVSKGMGLSVVPARFCCRPELALLTLRRGNDPTIARA
jgi:uncharacterized protein